MDAILSYCHYSLNDSTLLDLVPYLKKKGVGIINAGVLSMGLLTKYVSGRCSTQTKLCATSKNQSCQCFVVKPGSLAARLAPLIMDRLVSVVASA